VGEKRKNASRYAENKESEKVTGGYGQNHQIQSVVGETR